MVKSLLLFCDLFFGGFRMFYLYFGILFHIGIPNWQIPNWQHPPIGTSLKGQGIWITFTRSHAREFNATRNSASHHFPLGGSANGATDWGARTTGEKGGVEKRFFCLFFCCDWCGISIFSMEGVVVTPGCCRNGGWTWKLPGLLNSFWSIFSWSLEKS